MIKKGGGENRDKRPFSNIASYLIFTRQTVITIHVETTIKGEVKIHSGEKIRDHKELKNILFLRKRAGLRVSGAPFLSRLRVS